MKAIVFCLLGLLTLEIFAQEMGEEFLPVEVEGKEAYMSTKTGEFTFRAHDKTDATQLKTTASGVVYNNVSNYTVKKGETISSIAKKNGISILELKKHNKITSSNLKTGISLKIIKQEVLKSSSPVISYVGEERVIAKLRPGESPGQFAAPPSITAVENQVIETKKTEEKPAATIYKAETSVKNPIFGLSNNEVKETQDSGESIDDLSKAISQEMKELEEEKVVKKENIKENIKEKLLVVKTPKQIVKAESKEEKLTRLKAEIKALGAELDKEEPVKEIIVKQKVRKEVEEEVDEEVEEEVDEEIKELEKVVKPFKIQEPANGKKVVVFENKLKTDTTSPENTKKALAVKGIKKEVKASKVEKLKEEVKSISEQSKEESEKISKKEKKTTYTVEKGNTLWSISKKFNMTVEAIKMLNNLKNNNLSVGQKLKVIIK